jgi:DNA (cytosine-5)-methyltransferase 1
MEAEGMWVVKETRGIERVSDSELGLAFRGEALGTRATGGKPGSNTADAFAKLARIASTDDGLLNKAFGEALVAAGIIDSYELEADLGDGLRRKTDLLCVKAENSIRLEFMWRSKTGRAAIANYVLTKLFNYGRAIGFLTGTGEAEEIDEE